MAQQASSRLKNSPTPSGVVGLRESHVVDHRDRDSPVKQSNTDWGFRAGAGVDLYLTDQIAISIEAIQTWTVGDVKNIHHVSTGIGILYRF